MKKSILYTVACVSLSGVVALGQEPAEPTTEELMNAASAAELLGADKPKRTPLHVTLAALRTQAEAEAVGFLIDYAETLSELDILDAKPGMATNIFPDIKIQTGEEDAFSSLTAFLGVRIFKFEETVVDGVITADPTKLMNIFAINAGAETTRNFDNVAGLVELGWAPVKYSKHSNLKLGLNPAFATYLQGGYKVGIEDPDPDATGGDVDESAEDPDSALLRFKTEFSADIDLVELGNGKAIKLVPAAEFYYDFLNSEVYYSLRGILRLQLAEDKAFDFSYDKGSGAPNFNEGDQFGMGLRISF